MNSILDDIYDQIREPKHMIVAIRVGVNKYDEMCKEEARLGDYPHIHDDMTFMGIPIWMSKIELVKIIWSQ